MPVVKLFASLRAAAGSKEMHLPGEDVGAVLEHLLQAHPALVPLLMENGRLHIRGVLTLNGRTLDPESGMQTAVSEQDEIAIFPPIGGG